MSTSKNTMTTSASVEQPSSSNASRTRNGKIARLPLEIRAQLNRALEDGRQGKPLLAWLNALPEVRALVKDLFGGCLVSEQNLSQWRKGGYREWQKQQDRREMVRQWTEDAKGLERAAGGAMFSSSFSMILLAELAQAVRDILEEAIDAQTRLERLDGVARRFAQLRREESNAERMRVARERWNQEQAKVEEHKRAGGSLTPMHTLLLQQIYIDEFSRAGRNSMPAGAPQAESLDNPEQSSAADENTSHSK